MRTLVVVIVAAGILALQQVAGVNQWTQLFVPPYVECTLPLCDTLCDHIENTLGQICPRAVSSNLKVSGLMPGPDACLKKVQGWTPGPKKSDADPDGCGPCLLKEEKSVCNTRNLAGRGFNAGGPKPRRGHTMIRYETPLRSRYVGAVVLILFGGLDRNDKFLNDVWFYCVEKCPTVFLNKRTFDEFGVAIDYSICPPGNCGWEEKLVNQEFVDWLTYKEIKPSSIIHRGIVPSRPAGRMGHTVAISKAKNPKNDGTYIDVMAVYGGLSPNCTDYCADLWYYDIVQNWWVILYGEWWGVVHEWQTMWDYSQYGQSHPVKRWNHAAVMVDKYMFIIGGHTVGKTTACCGYDYVVCKESNPLIRLVPEKTCPYLHDLWVANLQEFVPLQSLLSKGKHATQSSTLGTGVARLAVDGNKDGHYSDTWNNSVTLTNSDSQAWWQIDLGGPQFVANVSIYNRQDRYSERLENFYVLFSSQPFASDQLQDLLKDPIVYKTHFMYIDDVVSMYINQVAQYVRIQLAGTNYLSLAEVEVWGYPPVEGWQHMEGMKRWTELQLYGDYPFGRMGHTATMISAQSVLLFGGYVKEDPYFLNDFWTVLLPSQGLESFEKPIQWEYVEPSRRTPSTTNNTRPVPRYGHSASFTGVCSVGYEIEKLVRDGKLVLSSVEQGVLPPFIYPGDPDGTPWCRGQVVFFGGSSTADRFDTSPAFPDGYLNDLWIYNVSSNTISEVQYDKGQPYPSARREHSSAINKDELFIYGGASYLCEKTVCGDFWMYNISGPGSCPRNCNGHGACEYGFCICQPGFRGVDCSGLNCPNSECAYSYEHHFFDCLECNGRGQCSLNGTCSCGRGWKGEACEVLFCPGNCSGHGTCKIGGLCECDTGFGGEDCFEAFCPNNCTAWGNQFDSGTQGDCIIQRVPPCCGIEPTCARSLTSPPFCTERTYDYVTPHNVSATCICSDAYTGVDCSLDTATEIVREQIALLGPQQSAGCFARDSLVRVLSHEGAWGHQPLSTVRAGDVVASVGRDGRHEASKVVFVHDHPEPTPTLLLHYASTSGHLGVVELTEWHAVPLAGECRVGTCSVGRQVAAKHVVVGHQILVAHQQGSEAARIVSITQGASLLRYVLTRNDRIIVNDAVNLVYSTTAGWLESLPFIVLDALWPSAFKHKAVESALALVLESPALRVIEEVIRAPWAGDLVTQGLDTRFYAARAPSSKVLLPVS